MEWWFTMTTNLSGYFIAFLFYNLVNSRGEEVMKKKKIVLLFTQKIKKKKEKKQGGGIVSRL
jgi:hypothetical protein